MKVSDDSTEERKECILLALQLIMKFRKGPSLFQTAIQDIAVIVFVTMTTWKTSLTMFRWSEGRDAKDALHTVTTSI